jgi:hypothetical protein
MKHKWTAAALGLIMSFSVLTAYAADETAATGISAASETLDSEENSEEPDVFGQVTSIHKDSITVALISVEEPEEQEPESETEAREISAKTGENATETDQKGTWPPEFSLTGEEITVPLTEDTVYTRGCSPFLPDDQEEEPLPDDSSEKPEEPEKISLEDIQPEDLVTILLDKEGNALSVQVEVASTAFSKELPETQPEKNPPVSDTKEADSEETAA